MRLIVFILRSNNHSLIIWSLITAIVYLSAVLGSWLLLSKLELLEMKFGIRGDGGDIELENLDFNDNFLSIDDYEDHYDARSDDKNLLKNYKRVKFFEFARNMTFSILPKNFSCHNKSQAITRNGRKSVFVIVKTRPHEIFQRHTIRQSYGSYFKGRLIFAVGRVPVDVASASSSNNIEKSINLESEKFADILRADFIDTYFNLTLKSFSILKWISVHCPNEAFYFQVDSDSVIYPLNLDAFVEKHLNVSRRIYGLCYLNADIHRRGKWKVPRRRLGSHHYPEYCIGAAYLMTGDVPSLLVDQINGRLGYLSIDDAYFSGILAEKARITRVDFKDGFKYKSDIDSSFFKKCPCRSLLASFEYKSPSLMKKAWNDYTKAESKCFNV